MRARAHPGRFGSISSNGFPEPLAALDLGGTARRSDSPPVTQRPHPSPPGFPRSSRRPKPDPARQVPEEDSPRLEGEERWGPTDAPSAAGDAQGCSGGSSPASRAVRAPTSGSNPRPSLFLCPRLPICWNPHSPSSCPLARGSPHPPAPCGPQPRCCAPLPRRSGSVPGTPPVQSRAGPPTTERPRLFQHPEVSRARATIRKAPESPSPAKK